MNKLIVDMGRNTAEATEVVLAGATEQAPSAVYDQEKVRISADARQAAIEREAQEDIERQMSPPGALGLPPEAEAARWKYSLIDDYYRIQPGYERVLVKQLDPGERVREGSSIILPDVSRNHAQMTTPYGIVVSAGLKARTILESQGYRLGDEVLFIRNALWSVPAGHIRGVEQRLIVLMAGDIVGSEDLGARLRSGEQMVVWSDEYNSYVVRENAQDKRLVEPTTSFDNE